MKIAIVELSESHEECLFSQISFLIDAGHEVSLYLHPKVKIQDYKHLINNVVIYDFDSIPKIKRFGLQLKLVKELKHFDKVIFNTASSSKSVRNILFFMKAYATECIGVIHSVDKLNKSFTQKIISKKIKKYLALSDLLKDSIVLKNKALKLESFYPIFFPLTPKFIKKNENETWICIPGRVYFQRRDYNYLLQKLTNISIPKHIKFIILGNINTPDGIILQDKIKENNLDNSFVFFNGFISNELYYNYIHSSDYIMPLLQKNDESYINTKITGSFNLAYGFKKMLLCHTFYKAIPDLNENGIFYDNQNLEEVLNNLHTNNSKELTTYKNPKWNYEYQKEKYLNFINS